MKAKKSKLLIELEKRDLLKVNIGWRTITIVPKKGHSFVFKDDEVHGYVDEIEGVIGIAEDLDDDSFIEVLYHEIIHAILFFVGLDDNDEDKVITTNEILTEQIAKGMLMFNRLNPELATIFASLGAADE